MRTHLPQSTARRAAAVLASVALLAGLAAAPVAQAAPVPSGVVTSGGAVAGASTRDTAARAAAISRIVRATMDRAHLKSVIVKVSIDGDVVLERAFGESMTGVPATTDMHFRNGSVAIGYTANVLLQLVDEGVVTLDDKVSRWLPDLPHADRVTLGQLARMTSGYRDYVHELDFILALMADPFRSWTPQEQLAFVVNQPLLYEPGTNWNYSHSNFVILGLALEQITGKPMRQVMRERILEPLALDQTRSSQTAAIPAPVLHAFSAERRQFLGVPEGTPFLEDSTFWNPSWTIARGTIQTTDIDDLHDSAVAFGTGALLSRESYRRSISTDLRGFGTTLPECPTTCRQQSVKYSYGVGLVTTGDWVMQNPMFGGYSAVAAYLPSQRVAIAVAVTYEEEAFANDGPGNQADVLFREIGRAMAPKSPPPS